jgi:chromosome segregation ATPase
MLELEQASAREKNLADDLESFKYEAKSLESAARQRQEELEESLVTLETDLKVSRKQIEVLHERTGHLESMNEQLTQERDSLQTELQETREEIGTYRQRDEQLKRDIGSLWGL